MSSTPMKTTDVPRCRPLREQFERRKGKTIEPEPERSLFDRLRERVLRWRNRL